MSKPKSHPADSQPPHRGFLRRFVGWGFRLAGGVLGLMVLTTIVVGTMTAVSYFITVHYIRGHDEIVPNITRQSVADALETLAPLGLALSYQESEYHDFVPEGAILRQHPRPGRRAKRGTPVQVVLSQGPEFTAAPDTTGLSLIDAGIMLRANGLAVGSVSRMPIAGAPVDEVVAQDPPPGNGLRRGQPVNLLASSGAPATLLSAPNLLGLTVPEVEMTLRNLGCTLGTVTERDGAPGTQAGTVLEQSPPPGASLLTGGTVNVVIARRF